MSAGEEPREETPSPESGADESGTEDSGTDESGPEESGPEESSTDESGTVQIGVVVDSESAAERARVPWVRRRWVALLAGVLLVVSAAAAASVYFSVYRPDRLTDEAVQQQVLTAAREGTEVILTYAPDTLDNDLTNAKSRLTGEFLDHYNDFTEQIVAPAARQKGIKTEANVARAAVSRITPQTATVLVFVNQVTTSKERPTPALSTSSVEVVLVREQGRWLISQFNPI